MSQAPIAEHTANKLSSAASLMEEALGLLDEANDPACVTPHLDLALSLLRQFTARLVGAEAQDTTNDFPDGQFRAAG